MKRLLSLLLTVAALVPSLADAQDRSFEVTTIVPAADEQPALWRFTTTNPGSNWLRPGFDDSKWKEGLGGFGTTGTPGAVIGTEWNTTNIWLRREFTLPDRLPRNPRLWLIYDEAPEVYLNGVLGARRTGWVTEYDEAQISPEALATLKPGRNLLAVHASQTYGGQCIDVGLVDAAPRQSSTNRWSPERAWTWFTNQALPIGFNYVPANSISYTEMWMGYAFDPELIDRELALAQDVGFNCLRVVLPFVVWEAEPEAFKKRFEMFLSICDKRGLKAMPCFFDDCVFGPITDPDFGKQPEVVVGWYANGWTPSPGHKRARDPKMRPALERYVKDIMAAHRSDPRILCWDLYNEPSNSGMGNASLSLLMDVFRWAREIDPAQPITSGIWGGSPRVTRFLRAESDIISFHNYRPAPELHREIQDLKRLERPLICSEWLNRPLKSTVETCLPVFVEERVGALNWGLVNGKTQTDLPWGHKPGKAYTGTWQHDLFRANHAAYDSQEIQTFKRAIAQAKRNSQGPGNSR
jgi:hypothetical protein